MWTPKKIRDLRLSYGETQKQFALRMGVSVTSVAWWEQGRSTPTGSAAKLLDRLREDKEKAAV